jgi:hypothetical protein
MKNTIVKYSRRRLENGYITAIWIIRTLVVTNLISLYYLWS